MDQYSRADSICQETPIDAGTHLLDLDQLCSAIRLLQTLRTEKVPAETKKTQAYNAGGRVVMMMKLTDNNDNIIGSKLVT